MNHGHGGPPCAPSTRQGFSHAARAVASAIERASPSNTGPHREPPARLAPHPPLPERSPQGNLHAARAENAPVAARAHRLLDRPTRRISRPKGSSMTRSIASRERRLATLLPTAWLALAAFDALAQPAASGPAGGRRAGVDRSDRRFVQQAARAGMAEVQLSKIAQERAQAPQVRAFAERMVKDHTEAHEELMTLARGKSIADLPGELDGEHRRAAERLQRLSGEAFDRAYMRQMVEDHKKAVSDFERAAKRADDAEIKAFAAAKLPALKAHLEQAEGMRDGTAGAASGSAGMASGPSGRGAPAPGRATSPGSAGTASAPSAGGTTPPRSPPPTTTPAPPGAPASR